VGRWFADSPVCARERGMEVLCHMEDVTKQRESVSVPRENLSAANGHASTESCLASSSFCSFFV